MNRRLELVTHEEPMLIVEREIPEAPPGGAVVKLHYSGICHSDVHLWEDKFDMGNGVIVKPSQQPYAKYPIVLGHEMAGEIYTIGSEASKKGGSLSVGKNVMVFPWLSCEDCNFCREEKSSLCPRAGHFSMGIAMDGGFQQYVSVPHVKYMIPVPSNVPMEVAALLPCSGITAYHAVRKSQPVVESASRASGEPSLLIVGAGGLGLWGIQIARSLLPQQTKIIVAEISESKFEAARHAGADETILWDPAGSIQERITTCKQFVGGPIGGVSAAIDFVGSSVTASSAFGCLAKNGTMVLVGLYGGTMGLSAPLVPLWNLTLTGVKYGDLEHLRELTKLMADGKVNAPPVAQVALEDTNQVFLDLKEGKRRGRTVVRHL